MNNPNAIICVFCEGIVAQAIDYTKTQYCVDCHDYKGLTTVREYQEMWS
jgi:ribosomal protein S26